MRRVAAVAAEVWAERVRAGELSLATQALYEGTLARFLLFAGACGVHDIADLDRRLCERFVFAGVSGLSACDVRRGRRPAAQTSRIRLIALRGFWAAAVQSGLDGQDPTLGVKISRTASRDLFPLTPPEADELRLRGRCGAEDTLRPVQVVLALAGASQVEISLARVADVDMAAETVAVPNRSAGIRLVPLEPLALPAVRARLADLGRRCRRSEVTWSSHPLALCHPVDHYKAASLSPMVASDLRRALDAAQIRRVGVTPASIQQYAANACYAVTGRMETVADLLGRRSLDAVRRLIDRDWQLQWADHVRDGDPRDRWGLPE